MWSTNDKTTTLGQCPNEMYRSSLTLSAVIETKKRWYRFSFLRMNCYILLLFPRMTVGVAWMVAVKRTKYLLGEAAKTYPLVFQLWNTNTTFYICYGKSFFCVAKIETVITLHSSVQNHLRKIYKTYIN